MSAGRRCNHPRLWYSRLDFAPPPPPASRTRIALVLLAFAFFLGGMLLEFSVGSHFIFFYAAGYKKVAWWTFLGLLPLTAGCMLSERMRNQIRLRYPTWWVRRLFMYPLMAAFVSATAVTAPLGWIAAHAWAMGTDTEPIPGRLVSVGKFRASLKGCDQRAELAVGKYMGAICLEGVAAIPMMANPSVTVHTRQSPLGLFVLQVMAQ